MFLIDFDFKHGVGKSFYYFTLHLDLILFCHLCTLYCLFARIGAYSSLHTPMLMFAFTSTKGQQLHCCCQLWIIAYIPQEVEREYSFFPLFFRLDGRCHVLAFLAPALLSHS